MAAATGTVYVAVHNESTRRWLYRRPHLTALADRICTGEGVDGGVEVSVLFCDDGLIQELNRHYRDVNAPTDVLSFEQAQVAPNAPRILGDVVISLETVERHCGGDRRAMRREIDLLFCHGLLHLLGHDHGTAKERAAMQAKQAAYLQLDSAAAWAFGPRIGNGARSPEGG